MGKINSNKDHLFVLLSEEHADRSSDIKEAFGDLNANVSASFVRLSAGDLPMQIIIFLAKYVANNISWDLIKIGIKKIYARYKDAHITLRDPQGIEFVVMPDQSVRVSVAADRIKEFEHIKTVDDVIVYLKNIHTVGWKQVYLCDIAKIYDGTHQTPKYVDNGVPFYSVEHVSRDDFTDTKYISEEVYEKECKRVKIEKGDILMTRIGDIGTAKYIDWDVRASFYVTLALIKRKSDDCENKFLTYLINSVEGQREIWNKTIHVAYPNKINLGDIGKCRFVIPPILEQRRIIAMLETWDKSIKELEKKIYLKKKLKKGLIQQLLTGEKRLPGFTENWEKKTLGQLFDITSSKRVFQNDWKNEGVPFYRAREVVKLSENGYVDNELFISREMYSLYKKKYGVPKIDDLLITGVGTIGILFRVKDEKEFYFKDGNIIWLKSKGKVSSAFIEQMFKTRFIRKQIFGSSPITTVATYTIDAAKKTVVFIPSSIEQKGITSILTTADDEIAILESKLTLWKSQKKYLLNNLVSGNIRTPENLTIN